MTRAGLASGLRWLLAAQLNIKNADAPLNKHWDLSVNDYVDNPDCGPGKHWSNDLYRCVPD
jgi:hypothetical protein